MVLILLNVFLFGLLQVASNEFGRDLLKSVSVFFSRIPEDAHQGSGVTSGDRSHTTVSHTTVQCSHTHLKPTAKLERDGSASPSIEVRAVAIR
jgi:hypothetical protein